MKTIKTTLYKFEELPERVKEKAIQKYYYFNVEHGTNWYQFTEENFKEENNKFFDIEKIYFSGFSSQGDGAMFEYSGITEELKNLAIDSLKLPLWKKAIIKSQSTVSGKGKHSGHYYHYRSVSHTIYVESNSAYDSKYSNINALIELYEGEIQDYIIELYEDLAKGLYNSLNKEHDELTSKESISESLIANDYYFNLKGQIDNSEGETDYRASLESLRQEVIEAIHVELDRINIPYIGDNEGFEAFIVSNDLGGQNNKFVSIDNKGKLFSKHVMSTDLIEYELNDSDVFIQDLIHILENLQTIK
jgi:hypothetical protein